MGYSPAKSRTRLSDWTKTITNPSKGLTTDYPEAWVLHLQVWQEQDVVAYLSRVSVSAHHPILRIFDSQVQDTLRFRTEKRADRGSCRLRKKGEDRERDRDRQTDTVLTTQTWSSERRGRKMRSWRWPWVWALSHGKFWSTGELESKWRGLENCCSVCLECPIIFWGETSEKTGIFFKNC